MPRGTVSITLFNVYPLCFLLPLGPFKYWICVYVFAFLTLTPLFIDKYKNRLYLKAASKAVQKTRKLMIFVSSILDDRIIVADILFLITFVQKFSLALQRVLETYVLSPEQ